MTASRCGSCASVKPSCTCSYKTNREVLQAVVACLEHIGAHTYLIDGADPTLARVYFWTQEDEECLVRLPMRDPLAAQVSLWTTNGYVHHSTYATRNSGPSGFANEACTATVQAWMVLS